MPRDHVGGGRPAVWRHEVWAFVGATVAVAACTASALAQAPPPPSPPPAPARTVSTTSRPAASRPSVPPPSARPAPRLAPSPPAPNAADMEARIRQLEALIQSMPSREHVRALEGQVRSLSGQVDELSTQLRAARARGPIAAPRAAGAFSERTSPLPSPLPDEGAGDDASDLIIGGISDVGPAAETPTARFQMPEPLTKRRAQAMFGPGFQIKTPDDEFDIQFHNLTQLDGRFYGIRDQSPVADTFDVAREWFIFNGHLTKPYEYFIALNSSFESVAPLEYYLNVNYDKRLQFRFGRVKSPFAYEFYGVGTQALANGEWSVFFNNFGMNRISGAMLWGQSVAERIDYAVGIFNSVPNAQLDLTSDKSAIAFVNFAPFRPNEGSFLENFNVGGSLVAGDQNFAPVPNVLRTIVPTAGSSVIGVPFLQFNNNVRATGPRNLWDLHTAFFRGGLSLIAEWQSGFVDYSLANQNSGRVRLPIESYYVQAAYLLTGERVASRGMVKPLRPFDLRPGKFGLGAWEVATRFAHLRLGDQVFRGGLADPTLWTNSLYVFDLGVNWYWNENIRVLFDWQHAGFASPVLYRPGGFSSSSDLFMLRFQIWF